MFSFLWKPALIFLFHTFQHPILSFVLVLRILFILSASIWLSLATFMLAFICWYSELPWWVEFLLVLVSVIVHYFTRRDCWFCTPPPNLEGRWISFFLPTCRLATPEVKSLPPLQYTLDQSLWCKPLAHGWLIITV